MTEDISFAVIGGSGLYDFPGLTNSELLDVDTPFGNTSSQILSGSLHGRRIAFLARHGKGHKISPTEVNYRANIYALKKLGTRSIVSISACGSLQEGFAPGDIVIPNQLFDHTHNRVRSFFENGIVVHVGVGDPFCERLNLEIFRSLKSTGTSKVHPGGKLITIEGPRFSTKNESNIYRSWGLSLIGMTASPEAFLAREAEICYSTMAHVTDYDVWHTSELPVSVEMVVKTLKENTGIAIKAISHLVQNIKEDSFCSCESALESAIITNKNDISPEIIDRLGIIIDKYIH
ncbi:S-methyl-5'-thioadenosine phosphorylase [Chloroflexota bacterium]